MRARLAAALLLSGCTYTPLKLTVTTVPPRVVWLGASVPTFVAHLRNRSAKTVRVSSLNVQVSSLACNGKRTIPTRCADALLGAHSETRDLAPGKETSFAIDIEYASVAGWSQCFAVSAAQKCEATFVYEDRGHADEIRAAPSNRVRFESR